ncbi:hypothetical protein KIW84_035976 [Lathyrus oleraceus]|uniref:Protein FAR1-RELATED SEQUENCE n=1 Tax=Pisum sativum TaxID=3888 RepID=A0A9D4Y2U9_PEA|nr:hypothetical protein KIW84_035976 [Pisum sativum]
MEKQAANTINIFIKFQDELVETMENPATKIDDAGTITTYRVAKFGENQTSHTVTFNSSEMKASCNYQMFEYSGIICWHVLAVFRAKNVLTLPPYYVLKRWTRNAKTGVPLDERATQLPCSSPDSTTVRYNSLRQEAIKTIPLRVCNDNTPHTFQVKPANGKGKAVQHQSKLLETIFSLTSKPLAKLATRISELYENFSQKHEMHSWTERFRLWLEELSVFKKSLLHNENALDEQIGVNQVPNEELPIWLAAQRAVTRYEGILSPVGLRERLLRGLLSWIGLIPLKSETSFQVENDSDSAEPYLRLTFFIKDITHPARTSLEELILLYTEENSKSNRYCKPVYITTDQGEMQHQHKLIILYATQTGNALDAAERLARETELPTVQRISIQMISIKPP